MHSNLPQILLTAAAITLAAPALHAGQPPFNPGKALSNATQVTSLKAAYSALASANHNYSNHRALAMQAIAQACSLLGTNINTADGKGGEWQFFSDLQLHQAQASLHMVLVGIPAGQQPQVSALLNTAINQITLALAVK